MEKAWKVLKVNILSIIALPLLLLATACKLISKALEKLPVILGLSVFAGLLALAFEFLKNPENGLNVIAGIIIAFVFASLIILILILILRLAAAIVSVIWNTIIAFFDAIYNATYAGFLNLFAICENDYQYISLNGKKAANALLCLFFTILRAVNALIVTIVSFASVALSILLVGSSLIGLSHDYRKSFGLNLFQAMARFDTFSLVYGIVMYLAIMAIFVVVLLSLGTEWHEWAMELKFTSEELSENIKALQGNDWSLEQKSDSTDDNSSHDDSVVASLNTLNNHIASLSPLGEQVENVLSQKDNTLLRSAWSNYYRNLSEITDECSKYKNGIPSDRFRQLMPRIGQLDKQREEVSQLTDKLARIIADPVRSSVFFAGCNTVEKLDKRYKSLCKAYHPDESGGDMETFQKMQEEYTNLKASL